MNKTILLNLVKGIANSFRDVFNLISLFAVIFLVAFWVKIGLSLVGV